MASEWFNDDQIDHIRAVSEAPVEKKCTCGWNWKHDCYGCNVKILIKAGGQSNAKGYFLPDGTEVEYSRVVAWLKENDN